jgi:hypothetical protein
VCAHTPWQRHCFGIATEAARLHDVANGFGDALAAAVASRYRLGMTAKERLRNLVEELSEEEAATALPIIERRRVDAMLRALAVAPPDDEESTTEEDAGARTALAEYERGEAITAEELKRDLGIA